MKIAVMGTGGVAAALGTRWAHLGHCVVFGSRDPQGEHIEQLVLGAGDNASAASIAQAAKDAEVVVLAVPWPAIQKVVEAAGDLSGKIVVDCSNPLNSQFTGLEFGHTTSAAEQIADWVPEAFVVKAFNTVSTAVMADPKFGREGAAVFVCGDNAHSVKVVSQLAEELGLEPVDAGPLPMARYLEPLAMLYIHLAVHKGWGSNCAFKVLRR